MFILNFIKNIKKNILHLCIGHLHVLHVLTVSHRAYFLFGRVYYSQVIDLQQ